jgi:F-type H+-transporting ATPase subunit delta
MAASSRIEERKVEAYARSLLEVAKGEDREAQEAGILRALLDLPHEITETLMVMMDRGEMDLLPGVVDCYQKIIEVEGDTVAVEVTTAVPLDDHLRELVTKTISEKLSSPVFIIEKVDPSIIGGIIINARGERRDASVRTQLANARQVLSAETHQGGE